MGQVKQPPVQNIPLNSTLYHDSPRAQCHTTNKTGFGVPYRPSVELADQSAAMYHHWSFRGEILGRTPWILGISLDQRGRLGC